MIQMRTSENKFITLCTTIAFLETLPFSMEEEEEQEEEGMEPMEGEQTPSFLMLQFGNSCSWLCKRVILQQMKQLT